MLQILGFTENNIIATKAEDNLTETDIQKIHPLIHNIVNSGQKVRWYFEMENFALPPIYNCRLTQNHH